MNSTKLIKWGNSQGVILPKHLCEHIGLAVGDKVEISVDAATHKIELTCQPPELDVQIG